MQEFDPNNYTGTSRGQHRQPLEKEYQLFESMVSTLQSHLQNTKEDQIEETSRLLRKQYIKFSEAHKVLHDHLEESIITNEVLRDWPTYYRQVFQQTRKTREQIQVLEKIRGMEEIMRNKIQERIVLEIAKLQKLERQAHQWVHQALPSLEKLDTIFPHMKRLLDAVEEKSQFMGPNMESIAHLSIQENMSTLSSITTLTIDFQKVLQSWAEFQHQLVVTTEAIVEICVQKRPTI